MRAVYYCRVSTDEENQINALESQIEEAKKCIASLDWELCGGYVDEGKTGTTTKKRSEYKRLFDNLSSNKFDVIVIKSQDRLMRNTKDWYVFIDALVANKKRLYFYLDNKFYTPDDALITGIKAILAEEYSRELSKKIKNAHRNRQEKGGAVLLTSATWGYDKAGKEVVVNEKEAGVVRLIYDLCLKGYGSRLISKELSRRGIRGRSGGYFPDVTVRRIIRNPLFKGTVVMNKKVMDFNTKKSVLTKKSDWKIHEGAVPAIVTPEVWEAANKIMDARSRVLKSAEFAERTVGRNLGKYDLSSKIFCGDCGSAYWRKYRKNRKDEGVRIIDWTCSEYIRRGRKKNTGGLEGCDNPNIKESSLINILSEINKNLLEDKKTLIIEHTMNIVEDVLKRDGIGGEVSECEKMERKIFCQKDVLLEKLLDGTISDGDFKRKNAELERQLDEAGKKKLGLLKSVSDSCDTSKRLDDIHAALNVVDMGSAQVIKLIKHIEKIVALPNGLEVYPDFCEKIVTDLPKKANPNISM